MRKLFLVLAVVSLGTLMLPGCDAITKATEITVDMPITIDIHAKASTLPNTQTNIVDVSKNSTFNDNKSKLKGVDLASVALALDSYMGLPTADVAVFNKITYTLTFDPSYGDPTVYTLGEFTNVPVLSFMSEERSFDVTNAELNAALDKLADRPIFTVTSTYSLQSGPGALTSMDGTVKLKFKLKASVL